MRSMLKLLAAAIAVVCFSTQASAITNGTPDFDHNYVGALMATGGVLGDRTVAWCTGTLVAPRVFLTAAHCFDENYGVTVTGVSFDQDPLAVGATPFIGIDAVRLHPEWVPGFESPGLYAFFDVALVRLDTAVSAVQPALLPAHREHDGFQQGKTRFRIVGYGLQQGLGNGNRVIDVNARYAGSSMFRGFVDYFQPGQTVPRQGPEQSQLIATSDAKGTGGGTCYGDSGGPLLVGTTSTLAGVLTTRGTPADNCVGSTRYVRLDTHPILHWVLATVADLS